MLTNKVSGRLSQSTGGPNSEVASNSASNGDLVQGGSSMSEINEMQGSQSTSCSSLSETESAIESAIEEEKIEEIQNFLKTNNVNSYLIRDFSLLDSAIWHLRLEEVKLLLNKGANSSFVDDCSITPLGFIKNVISEYSQLRESTQGSTDCYQLKKENYFLKDYIGTRELDCNTCDFGDVFDQIIQKAQEIQCFLEETQIKSPVPEVKKESLTTILSKLRVKELLEKHGYKKDDRGEHKIQLFPPEIKFSKGGGSHHTLPVGHFKYYAQKLFDELGPSEAAKVLSDNVLKSVPCVAFSVQQNSLCSIYRDFLLDRLKVLAEKENQENLQSFLWYEFMPFIVFMWDTRITSVYYQFSTPEKYGSEGPKVKLLNQSFKELLDNTPEDLDGLKKGIEEVQYKFFCTLDLIKCIKKSFKHSEVDKYDTKYLKRCLRDIEELLDDIVEGCLFTKLERSDNVSDEIKERLCNMFQLGKVESTEVLTICKKIEDKEIRKLLEIYESMQNFKHQSSQKDIDKQLLCNKFCEVVDLYEDEKKALQLDKLKENFTNITEMLWWF